MTDNATQSVQSGNRKVLLGIFGVPALVFVLSTALYYLVQSDVIQLGTVNNGELITPPLALSEVSSQRLNGGDDLFPDTDGRWTFMVIGDAACEGSCERMLYVARQSIVAMGKKMHRVRLAYLTTAEAIVPTLQQRIDEEYRGLELIHIAPDALDTLFAKAKPLPHQPRTFYVVDPQGWVMMYYQTQDTGQDTLNSLGKAVVRDMKRLIK